MDLDREPPAENVEVKARLDDPPRAVALALRLGAIDRGAVRQTDTYFTLGRYRLKLRETDQGASELIGYSRPDAAEPRTCQHRVSAVENPGAMKAALARQWGVKLVVQKTRRWFLWEGRVRIHVDHVDRLGDFLEFEAMVGALPGYDEPAARRDVDHLVAAFGLTPRDLVARSYADLLRAASGVPAGT